METPDNDPIKTRISRWDLKVHISEVRPVSDSSSPIVDKESFPVNIQTSESNSASRSTSITTESLPDVGLVEINKDKIDKHQPDYQKIQSMLQSPSISNLIDELSQGKLVENLSRSPSNAANNSEDQSPAVTHGDFSSSISDITDVSDIPLPPDRDDGKNDEQSDYQSIQEMLQDPSVIDLLGRIRRAQSVDHLSDSPSSSNHFEDKTNLSSEHDDFFSAIIHTGNVANVPIPPERDTRRLGDVNKAWHRFCRTLRHKGFPPPVVKPTELLRFLTSDLADSEWRTCFEQHQKRQKMMDEDSIIELKTDEKVWDRFESQKAPGKFRRGHLVSELLRKRTEVCKECSYKFEDSSRHSQELKDHMDAHLKERLKEWSGFSKQTTVIAHQWYPSGNEWLRKKHIEKVQEITMEETNVLSSKTLEKKCHVCHEDFEEFYDEDDESWKYRDTIEQQGKVIHNYCLSDFERSDSRTSEEVQPPTPEDEMIID